MLINNTISSSVYGVEWLVKNEMEKMWKEVVVAEFEMSYFLGGIEEQYIKQEVLGRTNRLLAFDATRTA
jgi:hypothetical protein